MNNFTNLQIECIALQKTIGDQAGTIRELRASTSRHGTETSNLCASLNAQTLTIRELRAALEAEKNKCDAATKEAANHYQQDTALIESVTIQRDAAREEAKHGQLALASLILQRDGARKEAINYFQALQQSREDLGQARDCIARQHKTVDALKIDLAHLREAHKVLQDALRVKHGAAREHTASEIGFAQDTESNLRSVLARTCEQRDQQSEIIHGLRAKVAEQGDIIRASKTVPFEWNHPEIENMRTDLRNLRAQRDRLLNQRDNALDTLRDTTRQLAETRDAHAAAVNRGGQWKKMAATRFSMMAEAQAARDAAIIRANNHAAHLAEARAKVSQLEAFLSPRFPDVPKPSDNNNNGVCCGQPKPSDNNNNGCRCDAPQCCCDAP